MQYYYFLTHKKQHKMNNTILIARTFTEFTPESAQDSDFSNNGFICEREAVTFSELVSLMREYYQPSCSPNNGSTHVWYSTGVYTSDYGTGTEREECIHFHQDNTPNIAKYWRLAAKFAGLIK